MPKKKKDSLKYGEARKRLEQILKDIEGSEVDVDDLSEMVKEAAELIQLCRKKLEKTRVEVEKVVGEIRLEEENGRDITEDACGSKAEDAEGEPVDEPF